jgi:three-Cys-motif partner protein
MNLLPRDTQTQIKHMILAEYLDTWGGIILNPKMRYLGKQRLNSGRKFEPHFVYVDCFSSVGRYSGDKHRSRDVVRGSPIIGIQALDKLMHSAQEDGVPIKINAILIEKDKKIYEGLQETLSAYNYAGRVRETNDFAGLKPGEVAILNADATKVVDKLVAYTTTGFTWAFYLLDPYGAGIPYDFVRPIVCQEHHDVMINFIYEDLNRKAGMARSEKVGAQQRQQVDNWTAVFGDATWKDIEQMVRRNPWDARWNIISDEPQEQDDRFGHAITEGEVAKRVESALVEHYKSVLKGMDPRLTVKLVDLQFPDKERTIFYLFLTTHDPTGALSLNKTLYDAKLWEYQIRNVRRLSKEIEETGQLTLFPVQEHMAEPKSPPRPTTDEIAAAVFDCFRGKTVTQREVFRELADTEYFQAEISKALRHLKQQGKAQFQGNLSHDKPPIKFVG